MKLVNAEIKSKKELAKRGITSPREGLVSYRPVALHNKFCLTLNS